MSLEQNIELLNKNIVALIGALQSIGNGHAEPPADKVVPLAPERPSKVAERLADEAPATVAEPAPLVTFDSMKNAVLKLAAKDRKAAVALLAKHNAKKVTDLPESLWAGVEFEAKAILGD
jgi:hypothetical protein